MKNNIPPLWEDINNINGGVITYKITKKNADNILSKHITHLHNIANELLEKETISGLDMENVIKGITKNKEPIEKDLKKPKARVRRKKTE